MENAGSTKADAAQFEMWMRAPRSLPSHVPPRALLDDFSAYFQLGLTHILDVQGYDHILFVVALVAAYTLRDARRLLWLVTAFTLGHSVTLALATLGLVTVDGGLVELLIPLTIVATALYTIWQERQPAGRYEAESKRSAYARYGLAAGFGLIHGLGFSSFLRAALGGEESLAVPLLGFNAGLEVGQIVILLGILIVGLCAVKLAGLTELAWTLVLSGVALGGALTLVVDALMR